MRDGNVFADRLEALARRVSRRRLDAALIFGEAITIPNIIGSFIIIFGITLLARS